MEGLAPFVVANPWKAVGLALAAGVLLGLDLPGTRLAFKALRLVAWRELETRWVPARA